MKFLSIIFILFLLAACSESPTGSDDNSNYLIDKSEPGCDIDFTAHNFKTILKDNSLFELKNYRGKVVVLDFWAVWCSFCKYSRPVLKEIYNKYKADTNFIMLGISINDKKESWEEYIIEKELNWFQTQNFSVIGADPKAIFCVDGIPNMIIIDKWGTIRAKYNPTNTLTISNKIDILLKE